MRYAGRYYSLQCSNFRELEDALRGVEWFRIEGFDFYFRKTSHTTAVGYHKPEDVYCLNGVCVNSPTTKKTIFCRFFEGDEDASKVYTGQKLNQLITSELFEWAKHMNKTNTSLTAFSGKKFESYINAIPALIFLNNYSTFRKGLVKGFEDRRADDPVAKEALELFDERHSKLSPPNFQEHIKN